MEIQYQLTREEIEESLICLNWKREGRRKIVTILILSVIAVFCIWKYWLEPGNVMMQFLICVLLFVLFIVAYLPTIRRKYKTAKMGRQKGVYKIQIPEESICHIYESEHVYTIVQNEETYCIPKRILQEKQEQKIRDVIKSHSNKYIVINIER